MEQVKTNEKVYEPSPNLKLLVNAIGKDGKSDIPTLETRTKKSSKFVIAVASAKSNTEYVKYHSATKQGSKIVKSAYVELLEKGYALLEEN